MNAKSRWIAGAAVASVVIIALGWFALISPARHSTAKFKSAAAAQVSQQSGLRLRLGILQSEARGESAQQALLAKAQQFIPATPSEPSLIRQLSATEAATGVDLQTVSFGNPAVQAASSSGSSSTSGSAWLYAMSVDINVTGTYAELTQFESDLETQTRSLLVTAVTEAPSAAAGSSSSATGSSAGKETATISGNVFMATGTPSASSS